MGDRRGSFQIETGVVGVVRRYLPRIKGSWKTGERRHRMYSCRLEVTDICSRFCSRICILTLCSKPFTRRPIHSMACPIRSTNYRVNGPGPCTEYSTENRVNGTEARLLNRRWGFGPFPPSHSRYQLHSLWRETEILPKLIHTNIHIVCSARKDRLRVLSRLWEVGRRENSMERNLKPCKWRLGCERFFRGRLGSVGCEKLILNEKCSFAMFLIS